MARKKERPGLMCFYEDWEGVVAECEPEEIGELFIAIMKYSQHGDFTEFKDRSMRLKFSELRKSSDRTARAYRAKTLRGSWLAWQRRNKDVKISFVDWALGYCKPEDVLFLHEHRDIELTQEEVQRIEAAVDGHDAE